MPISFAIAVLLLGCAFHTEVHGLVESNPGRSSVRVLDDDGTRWRLVLDEPNREVRYLEGCLVQVNGRRFFRRLQVTDWRVIDAGDGSEPWVGRLQRYGSHWMIRDRNSGAEILLDEASVGDLVAHEGQVVLIVGYVVGAHRIHVVAYRSLSD
jgi:hypothetical protein